MDAGGSGGPGASDAASAIRRRAELERAAYAPGASAEESRAALARLQAVDAAADPAVPAGQVSPVSPPSAPPSAPVSVVAPRPRASRRRTALVTGAAVLLLAVGVVAGVQIAQQQTSTTAASTLARAEADSDLGRALARPQQPSDLPIGYQAGSGSAYPGDSYRLLFDGQPRAGSAVLRWRVWIGEGADNDHLCLVAGHDSARIVSTCLPRADMFTSSVTLTSPVGTQPLSVVVTGGRVVVDVS